MWKLNLSVAASDDILFFAALGLLNKYLDFNDAEEYSTLTLLRSGGERVSLGKRSIQTISTLSPG